MKKPLSFLLLILIYSLGQAQTTEIELALSRLSGVSFQTVQKNSRYQVYQLLVRQPLDHSDTTKGYFFQKVYLSHKGFDAHTVMVTEGYNADQHRLSELTGFLDANQVQVEHRFFGESMPVRPDYKLLNLKQATADLHRIKQLLASVYRKKWISTGISKGGATTIFYRYFYPDDVDVSVPYVAPINQAYEEPRIYHFLDTVGNQACRDKIKAYQTEVLKNRDEILPLIKFYSLGAGAVYSYLSLEEAFEFAVMEYPFSFWQWGSSCENIPSSSATVEELTEYLLAESNPSFFGDAAIEYYGSHYYQSATEMGYYGYETSEFKEHLKALPVDRNPMALFFPFDMNEAFDGQLLKDLNQWLKTEAHQFIYIYGGQDTWSASAVPQNDQVDSEWFMLAGKHHGNARISSMNTQELKRFTETLQKWLSPGFSPARD